MTYRLAARSRTALIQPERVRPLLPAAISYRPLSSGVARTWIWAVDGFSTGGRPRLGWFMADIMPTHLMLDNPS